MAKARPALTVGGVSIDPGVRRGVEIPLARLYTHTEMAVPVEVLHGRRPGPRVFLSATLHGDEINGVEIIRRLLDRLDVERLRGTVLAVPIVNVFGFVYRSRYLPDRRDLNRSFPGSSRGSLAARLASLFLKEVVSGSDYGVDFHTAAPPRTNLPQVRANLRDEETLRCVKAFGAPVMVHGTGPDGSMRRVAPRHGVRVMVFEGGESQRFNPDTIQMGVDGTLRVLRELRMIRSAPRRGAFVTQEATRTRWIRARQSGILRLDTALGAKVSRGDVLGVISDPFGADAVTVRASFEGLVIGCTTHPLVYRGDAVVHLAQVEGGG